MLAADQKLIVELRTRISELEEELFNKNAQLEDVLQANSDFVDPQHTKVLHLRMNPTEDARLLLQNELSNLRHECERLRQRCNLLESAKERHKSTSGGANDSEDLSRLVDEAVAKRPDPLSEIEALHRKLQKAELHNTRTMEVFEKLTGRVQLACRRLLGYKLNLTSNGRQVRLRPALDRRGGAESSDENACFLFEMDESGDLLLLQNDFSRQHQEDIDHYVVRYGSFPAFTANLTLQAFGEQTNCL